MDRGWVGNRCRPNQRIGHGYDSALPLGQALEAKIGVMERTCLKWGYGLMDGVIGEASGVRRLSGFATTSSTLKHLLVAVNTINPAIHACTKGSLSALENADTRTFSLVL